MAPETSTTENVTAVSAAAPNRFGRLGSYELLVEVASGGMATVYLALDATPEASTPIVAIKRPHRHLVTDKLFASMLVDEARLASAIRHEHVVRVRELGYDGAEPYIVMDYVEGLSLSEIWKALQAQDRAIDVRIALRIVVDALHGLQAAHAQVDGDGHPLGIIHRDVSPHNVLVGVNGVSRLTDFGVAKAEDRIQETRTHEVKGKLSYMAPERVDARRMCTVQSDLFSMAVVLWECIAGRRLFHQEDPVGTLQEVMAAEIPSLSRMGLAVSDALDEVIARALSRDPEKRQRTAEQFAKELQVAAGADGLATRQDVAKLAELLAGPRLAQRHEQLRQAAPPLVDVDQALTRSGFAPRPPPDAKEVVARASVLDALAPPAPSPRYSLSTALLASRLGGGLPSAQRRWATTAVILGTIGLLLGIGMRRALSHRAATPPGAESLPTFSATTQASAARGARRVVVRLPVLSHRLRMDEAARELDPPTSVVVFDVPADASTRHEVFYEGLDGRRGHAVVKENDGIVQVNEPAAAVALDLDTTTGDLELPSPAVMPSSEKKPAMLPRRNGFTKLP